MFKAMRNYGKIAKEISSSENAQGEVKGQMEDYQKKEESQQEKIKVIPTAAEQVVLEDYQTSEFSMKLPTGWVVNSGGDGMPLVFAHTIHRTRSIKYLYF